MTEQEHHQAALQFAELFEVIDQQTNVAVAMSHLPFEELDQTTWLAIQAHQEVTIGLLANMRAMLQEGSKLIGNDAVLSHIAAVITAD